MKPEFVEAMLNTPLDERVRRVRGLSDPELAEIARLIFELRNRLDAVLARHDRTPTARELREELDL